jgi:hypothetical protein
VVSLERSPSAAASSSPGKSTKIAPSNAPTSLKLHEMALSWILFPQEKYGDWVGKIKDFGH